jgi:hypothetical protein
MEGNDDHDVHDANSSARVALLSGSYDDADAAAGVVVRDPSSSSTTRGDDASGGGGGGGVGSANGKMGAFTLAIMIFFNASGE